MAAMLLNVRYKTGIYVPKPFGQLYPPFLTRFRPFQPKGYRKHWVQWGHFSSILYWRYRPQVCTYLISFCSFPYPFPFHYLSLSSYDTTHQTSDDVVTGNRSPDVTVTRTLSCNRGLHSAYTWVIQYLRNVASCPSACYSETRVTKFQFSSCDFFSHF